MLTELKIITQEGCLCETEVQESGWNTHRLYRECVMLPVWAHGFVKESTAFHITHTHTYTYVQRNCAWCGVRIFSSAVSILAYQNRKEL